MRNFPCEIEILHCDPLFKKGDKNNLANYRLISLLISFYKVFEKVLYKRIMTHTNNNKILLHENLDLDLNQQIMLLTI